MFLWVSGKNVTISQTGYNDYSGTALINSGSTNVDFTMSPNTVSGTVYSAMGGNVGAGAVVIIAGITGTTNAGGYYSVNTVPTGSNRAVSITQDGYVNYSGTITLNNGSNSDDFTMQPNELTGTVTSSYDGSVVSGANVTISGISGSTNTGGVYTLYAVPEGNSQAVTATMFGFATYLGYTNILKGLNTFDFVMTSNPGIVTGIVTSSAGGILPGVQVTIAGVRGVTDSNGMYWISGVPAGYQ